MPRRSSAASRSTTSSAGCSTPSPRRPTGWGETPMSASPRWLHRAAGVINPIGWVVLGLGGLLAGVAAVAHWREAAVLAAACLLLLALALPFLVGRTTVDV